MSDAAQPDDSREQLARHAHALRRAGATVASIADQMGLHPSKVRRLLAREGKRLQLERRQLAAVALDVELDRLDAGLRRAFAIMQNADSDPLTVLKAIDRVVKIGAARAKLLGLEAPAKVSVSCGYEAPTISPAARDKQRVEKIMELLGRAGGQSDDEKAGEKSGE